MKLPKLDEKKKKLNINTLCLLKIILKNTITWQIDILKKLFIIIDKITNQVLRIIFSIYIIYIKYSNYANNAYI